MEMIRIIRRKIRYLVLFTIPIWSPVTPRAYSITIPSWYVEISAPVPVIPASQIQRPPLRIPGEPIPIPKRRRGRPPKPEQGIGTSENPRGRGRPRQQAIGGVESGNQKVTRSTMKVSRECFDSISSTLQDLRRRVIHLGNNLAITRGEVNHLRYDIDERFAMSCGGRREQWISLREDFSFLALSSKPLGESSWSKANSMRGLPPGSTVCKNL